MNSAILMFTLLLLDLDRAELGALAQPVWQIKDPAQLRAPAREQLVRLEFYALVPSELPGVQIWTRTPIGERAARALGLPGPD